MKEAYPEDVSPIELAKALLASMRKQQARCYSTSAVDSQSGLDLDMLRSLDQISFDVVKIIRGMINLHSPVARLPAELLLQVFANVPRRCVTHVKHKDAYTFPNMWEATDLSPLTAVCCQWRELALTSSFLWSTLLVDEQLENRPSKVPLCARYLHLCTVGPIYVAIRSIRKGSRILRLLEDILERVRELHVEVPWVDWSTHPHPAPDVNEDPTSQGMSSRSRLVLSLPGFPNLEHCAWNGDHGIDPPRAPFPKYRFCGSPQLRTLELFHPSSIPPHAYPALTHLLISSSGRCFNGNSGQVLRLLSSTPQLRVLVLQALYDECISDQRHVELPLLRHLETTGFNYSLLGFTMTPDFQRFRTALFSSLEIPPSCTINYGPMHAEDIMPSAIHLPYIHTATRLRIHRDRTGSYSETSMQFSAENGTQSASWTVCTATPYSYTLHTRNASHRNALVTPLASLALGIRKLSIDRYSNWLYGARPFSIICAFPRLACLRLHPHCDSSPRSAEALSENLGYILEALQVDAVGERNDRHPGPPACPELTRLWVDWPAVEDFDEPLPNPGSASRYEHRDSVYGRPPTAIVDSLRTMADGRAAVGHPLFRVFLTYPRLRTPDGNYAYTVDEYDGGVTQILRSTEVEPLGVGPRSTKLKPFGIGVERPSSEEPLEALFAQEWDRVEDPQA